MNGKDVYNIAVRLNSLTVFRKLLEKAPLSQLLALLESGGDMLGKAGLYADLVYSLSGDGFDFSKALCRAVFEDENEYVKREASGRPVPDAMKRNAEKDLGLLSYLCKEAQNICKAAVADGYDAPEFCSESVDLVKEYEKRVKNVRKCGYGLFSSASMFRVDGGRIVPVGSADSVTEDRLFGYEDERKQLCGNIEALLDGIPASNMLLYGDAGTGKSSAVKACVNKYAKRGLRLIELRKDQLLTLPSVVERLRDDPLKFIIFIDDLSFTKNDDSFGMLKAALEGSASAATENAVICATSNRRHIVKESFSDREGDDVHINDTVQELMSLSDRFGLQIYFKKPDKALYLHIVRCLCGIYGLDVDENTDTKAEAFALGKGGRSPRTAEQFVKTEVIKRGTK